MEIKQAAVIGACGKMGRGIALLLLQEMALNPLHETHLSLIDPDTSKYYELKTYLRGQMLRFAEKNINKLRVIYQDRSDLVSNRDMIEAFLARALSLIDCSPSLAAAKGSKFVFEAAFEDIALKTAILKEIGTESLVFTNTSSIPIGELAVSSGLNDRLIGFHFYNPPAVQKLLEIIPSKETSKELEKLALELGKRLGKTIVISKDVPGFIGNGHFAAEIVYACELAESLENGVELVDRITRDYLLRPMGIFQLLDYVGLPIVEKILSIMHLKAPLIEKWRKDGLIGGEAKNGIFCYSHGIQEAVWSLKAHAYVPLSIKKDEAPLGLSWKKIQKNPELTLELPRYFETLMSLPTDEAKIAVRYLKKSKEIADSLVANKIAASSQDVATVLKNGFFHAYSPSEVLK